MIVEDDTGCVMAVVPANRNVLLGRLSRLLDRRHLRLADELEARPVVYVEAGDHEQLLRLSHDQFHELMLAARHGRFCGERIH